MSSSHVKKEFLVYNSIPQKIYLSPPSVLSFGRILPPPPVFCARPVHFPIICSGICRSQQYYLEYVILKVPVYYKYRYRLGMALTLTPSLADVLTGAPIQGMVLRFDEKSEIGAHVWSNLGYMICLWHLSQNLIFFSEMPFLPSSSEYHGTGCLYVSL